MSEDTQIEFNRKVSNEVSSIYERLHGEIFNPIEQERLIVALKQAIAAVRTESTQLVGLDFGCGSGNLTRRLINLGIRTVSADVSDKFLKGIERRFSGTGLSETVGINGKDLSNFESGRFDFVATYSVLHHVPDYLAIVREMCRVLKVGGVLYIDHEVNESYWNRPAEYVEFLRKARPKVDFKRYLRLLLDVRGYIHILRRLVNPRYKREGDIHVWPDDHIEWDEIERVLTGEGLEVIVREDYLVYRSSYRKHVYELHKSKCSDTRMLIARKR
jgi:ubiquinone/menaquinone biosynthesis C-methylase UbiE